MNKTLKSNVYVFTDLDGLIKLLLVIALALLPFYFGNPVSYGIFLVYLLLITLVSGIRVRTLSLSGASYAIIVLIPYLFGSLMNGLFYYLTKNETFLLQDPQTVGLRLGRLFIIWYVSILYFHTTPMETILGLLDKFSFPLKRLKLPVQDYLKIIMCIVLDLKGTGKEMKTGFVEQARSASGGSGSKLRLKIKGISQTIVRTLVDSFQRLDKTESLVAQLRPEELFDYQFTFTKREGITVLSLILLLVMLYFIEKGNLQL